MSDAYKKAKPGRLVFKGGEAASLHKPPKKHKKNKKPASDGPADAEAEGAAAAPSNKKPASDGPADAEAEGAAAAPSVEGAAEGPGGDEYTIDAAKRMKYEDLFPVETKKFGYDPANAAKASRSRTVEEALDDRVRKKADRYCK